MVCQLGGRKIVKTIRNALRVPVVTAEWLLGGGATWQDPSHSLRKEGGHPVCQGGARHPEESEADWSRWLLEKPCHVRVEGGGGKMIYLFANVL